MDIGADETFKASDGPPPPSAIPDAKVRNAKVTMEVGAEAHRPDVLVVARLEGAACVHLDYLRAAHVRGIPTIFLPLSQDDVARAGLPGEVPGCVAVWNRAQRSEAIDAGVPSRRTCVTGASSTGVPRWTGRRSPETSASNRGAP